MLAKVAKDVFLRSLVKFNYLKPLASVNSQIFRANSSNSESANPAAAANSAEQNNNNNGEIELKEKLAKCELDLADVKDKYLRAMAETENTRVRMRKEIDNVKIFGIQSFCKDLLEVADVLNLAIVNTKPKDGAVADSSAKEQLQSMHQGLVMTESRLLKIFEKHGLVRILPSEGEKFDPNMHEAIFRIPDSDQQSGTIKIVSKIGYKLHERVIRAAQVGVVQ